ncbi:MAG: hypothetical protein EOL87_11395 [Spartobacteria bacterium]|nr:hypothetical protein [Spartobacteria bacterium]
MIIGILEHLTKFIASFRLNTALKLGAGMGWVYGHVIRYHRKDAFDALERAFPQQTLTQRRALVNQMYKHLGKNIVESIRIFGGRFDDIKQRVQVRGLEHLESAMQRGRGALILTAHYGNWDVLSVMTPAVGYPLTIISKDLKQDSLNEFWMQCRESYGVTILPARKSYRKAVSSLRKGGLVGFILDQNMTRDEGVFVDYFGRQACTTPGLAFMSAQSKAPVVPVFIHRTPDDQHVIEVLPVIPAPENREPDTILAATQAYTSIIEQMVREHPEQWIWIHRRWRTVPLPGNENQEAGE